MSVQVQTKAVVTVAEMARMCALSRARFYQLVRAGTFPTPQYDVRTRRPIYSEELQQIVLEVRKRNCGVDGRPVLFYTRGSRPIGPPKPVRAITAKSKSGNHAELIDGLAALGLTATAEQVEVAKKFSYPRGIENEDRSEVLRTIFLHLKRQNLADNAGR